MHPGSIVAACAPLMLLQPSSASAQAATPEYSMRPAWITEDGYGDVIVYVADIFRLSAPIAPQQLNMVTIRRSNPGDARNSPQEDLDALFRYLKTNSGFTVRDFVAFASSRDVIRVYFRGDYAALAAKFDHPKSTMTIATAQDWTRLRAIDIADFARFIAKSASSQADLQRKLLGDKVPPAEARTLELRLVIDAASPDRGRDVAAALRSKRFDSTTTQVTFGADPRSLVVEARMRFSETLVQKVMNETCEDAAQAGGRCVAWVGRFQNVQMELTP